MSMTAGHRIETVDGVPLAERGNGGGVEPVAVSRSAVSSELLEELVALAAEKVRAEGLRLLGEGGLPAEGRLLPELSAAASRH